MKKNTYSEVRLEILKLLVSCNGKNFLEINQILNKCGQIILPNKNFVKGTNLEYLPELMMNVNRGMVKKEELEMRLKNLRLTLQEEIEKENLGRRAA